MISQNNLTPIKTFKDHLYHNLAQPGEFRDLIDSVLRYPSLNKVQVQSFYPLIDSNDNTLINAPTGCGKTFLFELTILRQLILNPVDQENPKNRIKAVYVAPTKSLCHEISYNWHKVFQGLNIIELNSDNLFSYREEQEEIQCADIIITTPEKFDILIKRWKNHLSLIEKLGLVLIDELHLLDDEKRGPAIESSLTRLSFLQTQNNFNIKARVVAASASFSNVNEVASWLKVPPKNLLIFGSEYRPVAIQEIVKTYRKGKNPYVFGMGLNKHLLQLIEDYSEDKPVLVFCSTQKSTQQAAEAIIQASNQRRFIENEQHLQLLTRSSTQISNPSLRSCLINGVGFHNAGLKMETRRLIESLYRRGCLKLLCTTSTLAQGVNLPAFLVIIKGTYCYRGTNAGFQEYKAHEILQMIGRAGRPQYESEARSIIMTET